MRSMTEELEGATARRVFNRTLRLIVEKNGDRGKLEERILHVELFLDLYLSGLIIKEPWQTRKAFLSMNKNDMLKG